jgi:Fe-S cluster assembly iron-binding protein IscA
MGNALYVENDNGAVVIVDKHDYNILEGDSTAIEKTQARILYDLVSNDIIRSVTADGYVRMRTRDGFTIRTYSVQDTKFKVDFTRALM